MSGRTWTAEEDALLIAQYGQRTAAEIAAELGRTEKSVYQHAHTLGLATPHKPLPADLDQTIRRLNVDGYTDSEIALHVGFDRHLITRRRKALNLPSNAFSERRRARVAAKTHEQLAAAGVSTLGELRSQKYREFAARRGWPEDLPPRAVQILDVLYERGPQTRRQLCEAIGMPWKGSRKSLTHAKRPGGSYLAELMRRGLVDSLVRGHKVAGMGRGRSQDVYFLPLTIKRGDPTTWPPQPETAGQPAGQPEERTARPR